MSREEECIIDPAATGRCMRGTIRCSRHPFVPPSFAPKSSSPMPSAAEWAWEGVALDTSHATNGKATLAVWPWKSTDQWRWEVFFPATGEDPYTVGYADSKEEAQRCAERSAAEAGPTSVDSLLVDGLVYNAAGVRTLRRQLDDLIEWKKAARSSGISLTLAEARALRASVMGDAFSTSDIDSALKKVEAAEAT